MNKTDITRDIAKVRRDMGRNQTVMGLMDALEQLLQGAPVEVAVQPATWQEEPPAPVSETSSGCPLCEARKTADRLRQQRLRKKRQEGKRI